jgi:hypothetical protein
MQEIQYNSTLTTGRVRVSLAEREWRGMSRKEALRQLDLGQSVAEFETDLKHYFVETETFRSLIQGRVDIVAGDKGTGKSALFKILSERYGDEPALKHIEVIPAFNASGDPVFRQLAEGAVLTEGQYRTVWKTYVLSLAGNWLLDLFNGEWTDSMSKLDGLLRRLDLRETDQSPKGIFSRLVGLIKRIMTPTRAGIEVSWDDAGMPVATPHVEFGDKETPTTEPIIVRHTESLSLLNDALDEAGITAWLVLDRLDEAFAGALLVEIPALRALFRTYLDLLEFDRIRLKMFVRKDLFRRITEGGFVNLTHINDRKVEIVWDDDDLLNLLIQRVRANEPFMDTAKLSGKSNMEIFKALFPEQVEEGSRRPTTLKWMLSRIRDGQDVKPPRNLIDLVKKAQEEQLRREGREAHEFVTGEPLFEPEAIKDAQSRLSRDRVVDTLLAESGQLRGIIEKFRDGKAEYNHESLQKRLGWEFHVDGEAATRGAIRELTDMGFLERIRQSETFKVPMLYRDGLNITQGKAFQSGDEEGEDLSEEEA